MPVVGVPRPRPWSAPGRRRPRSRRGPPPCRRTSGARSRRFRDSPGCRSGWSSSWRRCRCRRRCRRGPPSRRRRSRGAATGADPVGFVSTWDGLARVARRARHGHDDTARVHGDDPVDGRALAAITGRQVVDERESGVGHAHAVRRAVDLDDRATGGDRGRRRRRPDPAALAGSDCCGQFAELLPSISTITSQTVTGTSASTAPVCVAGPLVPVVSQPLDVFPTSPTLTEQMLTGASALMAPFCDVDAGTGCRRARTPRPPGSAGRWRCPAP